MMASEGKSRSRPVEDLALGSFPVSWSINPSMILGMDGFHGREVDLTVVEGRWLARLGSGVLGGEGRCDRMVSSSANNSLILGIFSR